MSRPHENRVRRVVHVLPVADARLRKLAVVHGTLGRAVDALVGVGGKKPRAKLRAKTHNNSLVGEPSRESGRQPRNKMTYDPSKFTVPLENGERMKVSELNTYQAEQQICKLLTLIREVQIAQLVAAESIGQKLQKAGIEIVK